MAVHQTGNKPYSKPMENQLYNTYIWHKGEKDELTEMVLKASTQNILL